MPPRIYLRRHEELVLKSRPKNGAKLPSEPALNFPPPGPSTPVTRTGVAFAPPNNSIAWPTMPHVFSARALASRLGPFEATYASPFFFASGSRLANCRGIPGVLRMARLQYGPAHLKMFEIGVSPSKKRNGAETICDDLFFFG